MSRRWWSALAAVAIVAVAVGLVWGNWARSAVVPSPSPTAVTSSATPSIAPSASQATVPTPTTTATVEPTQTPVATPTPATPVTTPPPRATGAPRLAYAAFLLRINDDRATVERLNGALTTAAQAQDPDAVRAAAVDILDFVDSERDWLRDNPPAECYAEAHASAGAMLEAYGGAADAFVAWAETGGGFAGLAALGTALDAAETAGDALTAFGRVLDGTRCPA